MQVAARIREALHHCGIHSTTIQPEYMSPGAAIVRKVRRDSFVSLVARTGRLIKRGTRLVAVLDVFNQLPA